MRIANNIMAMNTHRSYTINNDKVALSAQKLSSGYRINSAADDAAGLGISEKMRSQIRGLNMASRNSQDAISLIQTAEGALQEVHSMLQRMNELSVQSATGTNEDFDRTQIAKEFDQLKREINDIADQTTFNNMKLLDGSLSNNGVQRSAATTGLYDDIAEVANKVTLVNNVVPPVPDTPAKAAQKAGFDVQVGSAAMTTNANGAELEIKTTADAAGFKITLNQADLDAINADATKITSADLASAFAAKAATVTLNGQTFDVTATGSKVSFKQAADPVAAGTDDVKLAGLAATVTGGASAVLDTAPTITTAAATEGTGASKATFAMNFTTAGDVTSGNKVTLNFSLNGQTFSVESDAATANITTANDIASLFDGKTVSIDATGTGASAQTFTISAAAGTLTFTGDIDEVTSIGTPTAFSMTMGTKTAGGPAITATNSNVKNGAVATAAVPGTPGSNTIKFDLNDDGSVKVAVGDLIKIDGTTYEFVGAGKTAADGNVAIEWDAGKTATDLATALDDAGLGTKFTVTGNDVDGTLMLEQVVSGEGDMYAYMTPTSTKSSVVEFDVAKLKEGDVIEITLTDENGQDHTASYMHNGQNTRHEIGDIFQNAFQGVTNVELRGNTLQFESGTAKVDLKPVEMDDFGTMRIQVGALENEQLNIEVKAMNTAGLGLDEHDIYDQDSAGKAITAVRDAVNQVSDQRALLGAMQNRMTHKINNIKVSAENLQASESRIRDVDIASEMTEFTKANILSQAATAMLAQANSAPQNVLSLLR